MSLMYKKMNHWITKEEEELMKTLVEFSSFKNRGELIRYLLKEFAEKLQVDIPDGYIVEVSRHIKKKNDV